MRRKPEYGNETCCQNCGDEWAILNNDEHCPECAETYEQYNKPQPTEKETQ